MWTRLLGISVLLLLLASPVFAQDTGTYASFRLPEGQRISVLGETYQAYTLSEYTTLLQMDVDLRFYSDAYTEHLDAIQRYADLVNELSLALNAANEQIAILEHERERLTEQWTEENRLRHDAENGFSIGGWLSWGLAGLEAVAIITLAAILAVTGV